MTPDAGESQILADAACWLERVRTGNAADHRAFHAWLQERPEHVAAMDLVERAWRQAPAAAGSAGLRARARPAPRVALPAMPSWSWPALGTAMAVACAALMWTGSTHDQRITAGPDGVRVATLVDGSRVWLTPGSSVALHTTLLDRSVALQGEALFDVQHERRSFAVTAGDVRVIDRGTLFSVAQRDQRTSVILARGAIDIEDRQSGATIAQPHPGQQVAIDGAGAVVSAIDASAALSWREGRLVAENMPLSAVAARFEQLGGSRIRIVDPSIASLRVYGTYRPDDATRFLDAMAALYPIAWRRTGDGYEVRRR